MNLNKKSRPTANISLQTMQVHQIKQTGPVLSAVSKPFSPLNKTKRKIKSTVANYPTLR